MKIGITQDGKVSFTGMNPGLAEALIDLAEDLLKGNAVLLYGPGYIPVAKPTQALKDEFDRLLHADAKMLGGIGAVDDRTEEDRRWFSSVPLQEETHIQVWTEIEISDPDATTQE